jgi:hypothetical protein
MKIDMKVDRLEKIEKRITEIVEYAIYGYEVKSNVESIMELIREEIDYENKIN